ncbi:exodeoxyribonuclease III [Niabella sp. W65]|nr:exodeoxyribonuclease III [Niabella sp. W65]MCH7367372.1 exodeoxyribonuclease III [Niabella sp. W65]
MRIISYNVNGIRAAIKRVYWIGCRQILQILSASRKPRQKKTISTVPPLMNWVITTTGFLHKKKGYSGVAVFTRIKPDNVTYGTGHQVSDDEGRVIQLDFGDIRLINAYFPSGTSGDLRQAFKYMWLDEFYMYLNELKRTHPQLIICGDYNIAHKEIDIHDPKGNKKSSGFLPEERAWMDKFVTGGYNDTFRLIHPEAAHQYSWWSQRFPSVRLNNKGWRIDYITVTDPLKNKVSDAEIFPDVKHSDHCPIYVKLDL